MQPFACSRSQVRRIWPWREHIYFESSDYERARAELAIAQRLLPNNSETYWFASLIDRREGRWSDHIRNLRRAVELDPRNVSMLCSLTTELLVLPRL